MRLDNRSVLENYKKKEYAWGAKTCEEDTNMKQENKFIIKVTKNGPYMASGGIPLSEQYVCVDSDEQCNGWKEGKKYPAQESYALCRCGKTLKQTILRWQSSKIETNKFGR